MELVLNNPFRVLGLSATASPRDIVKRVSDLEMFAELGKSKSYPSDFPVLGSVNRSIESIKDAARKIENAEGRLFYSFFWFRVGDSVDELSLDCISAGKLKDASDIWSNQLLKNDVKKNTWRLNRSVLNLIFAAKENLDTELFDLALEDIGYVIGDDLDASIEVVFSGNDAGLNINNISKLVIDELIIFVQTYSSWPYGNNLLDIIDSFWSFPEVGISYVSAKILNPQIELIKAAIKKSEELRGEEDIESLKSKNNLDKVESIIRQLEDVLGGDDPSFQSIANAYANEVCVCGILALNKFDNSNIALLLINWADSLPSYSQVKSRIEENKETLVDHIQKEEEEKRYGEILKMLQVKLITISQAAAMQMRLNGELSRIKSQLDPVDEHFLVISSTCANHVLEFLIGNLNRAQDRFAIYKNIPELQADVNQAVRVTKRLLHMDINQVMRVRVKSNLETMSAMNQKLTEALSAVNTPSSNDISGQFIGWMLIFGVSFLLLMCKG